ncbi:MAG: hypothetical protein VX460_03115 [Planctomycetota bacterium]|nr:hypothetical protein [Planctomycetota bacterium]
MRPPRAALRGARIAVIVAVLAGAGYIASRFTLITLPANGCSPVSRFLAGDRLLVDTRPRPLTAGDAVLVREVGGALQLTLVQVVRPENGSLWCDGDRADCPGFGSESSGWIPASAVAGRVLLGWSP